MLTTMSAMSQNDYCYLFLTCIILAYTRYSLPLSHCMLFKVNKEIKT